MADKLASQQLMKAVYERTAARKGLGENAKKVYLRWAKNLPSMIQISGLAQAIVWQCEKASDAKDKEKNERKYLLADLAIVLGLAGATEEDMACARKFQERVVSESNVMEYMRLTRRVQQALEYFKRFAVSVMGAKDENGSD